MKKSILLGTTLALVGLAIVSTNAQTQTTTSTTTWSIDPAHSVAEFKVKHMMIANVKGHFSKVAGVLVHDESDRTKSRVEAK